MTCCDQSAPASSNLPRTRRPPLCHQRGHRAHQPVLRCLGDLSGSPGILGCLDRWHADSTEVSMVGQPNRRGWGRIRKLPSKRWQANYVGPDRRGTTRRTPSPRRWTPNAGSPTSAGQSSARVDAAGSTPGGRKAKGVTLGEYASTWLAQRRLKHRTKAHYEALIRNHITPRLGGVALRHLTPAAVRAWYAAPIRTTGPPAATPTRCTASAPRRWTTGCWGTTRARSRGR